MSTIVNYVSFGDTHIGCKLALAPPATVADFGARLAQSDNQKVLWSWFNEFFNEFVPWATKGEPFALVHGGDIVDGVHHRSTTQTTQDMAAQEALAVQTLEPFVERAHAFYCIAGTPAHAGESWIAERRIARDLGAVAVPGTNDERLFMEVNMMVGDALVNDLHHVSVASTHQSDPAGLQRELIEQQITAAKAGARAPDVILRHHRHRNCHVNVPTEGGNRAHAVAVPGWQLKTPFVWKTPGRNHLPHFGGAVIRYETTPWGHGRVEIRQFTRTIKPDAPIVMTIGGGDERDYAECV